MLYKVYKFKPGKVFLFLVILLFHTLTIIAQPHTIRAMHLNDQLKSYTWQKRVLLIISPSGDDEKCLKQKAILEQKKDGVQQRDMVVITKVADDLSQTDKAFLDTKFGSKYMQFNAILIGKDGGPKLKSLEPISLEKLFETIDAMPMRQQEMNNNKE